MYRAHPSYPRAFGRAVRGEHHPHHPTPPHRRHRARRLHAGRGVLACRNNGPAGQPILPDDSGRPGSGPAARPSGIGRRGRRTMCRRRRWRCPNRWSSRPFFVLWARCGWTLRSAGHRQDSVAGTSVSPGRPFAPRGRRIVAAGGASPGHGPVRRNPWAGPSRPGGAVEAAFAPSGRADPDRRQPRVPRRPAAPSRRCTRGYNPSPRWGEGLAGRAAA